MKLTVKTLKGEKFPIEVELSTTVAAVKGIIETTKPETAGCAMKLIHSGKVLKDEDKLEKYGVKPNDFLVVMVTKPKKPAAAPAPAPAAAASTAAASTTTTTTTAPSPAVPPTPGTTTTPSATTPAAATITTTTTESSSMAAAATPAPSATTTTTSAAPSAPPAPARSDDAEFPGEAVANLVGLGFPEAEVRHCLRAAQGNPDVAVEFLTNGIPPNMPTPSATTATPNRSVTTTTTGGSSSSSSSGAPLQALRQHPQFNDLRRLVQTNPQMLQQVLTLIGRQQPELLQEINANQALFLEMMNEPIDTNAPPSSSTTSSSSAPRAPAPPAGAGAGGMGLAADPMQMAQMMQNMDPAQLQMMANVMGLTPDQVQALGRMIGQMPPEQLQEHLAQAMQETGGSFGGGPTVLHLTEEEMAAVDRLAEMGFDRTRAAEAFLACDKNEALAANFLMDSAAQDNAYFGGAGGGGGGGGGGSGGNNNNNNNNGGGNGGGDNDDNVEDMYD
eukprot:CAMPEP_0116571052 /NCGR_PEP_ID=MMETSP0397-20121206/17326_1 /TAXON_ID=216820 /ORGANISM="Cyclophora tenuis, Strain ECT3854" /LENGTH=501 /DNA_ID=CAMNT_0004099067 /DNA_START=40 /DNA_END=1545 /DNA_ORIENTATION=-